MCVYMYVYMTCFLFGKATDKIDGGGEGGFSLFWGFFLTSGGVLIIGMIQVTHHGGPSCRKPR